MGAKAGNSNPPRCDGYGEISWRKQKKKNTEHACERAERYEQKNQHTITAGAEQFMEWIACVHIYLHVRYSREEKAAVDSSLFGRIRLADCGEMWLDC